MEARAEVIVAVACVGHVRKVRGQEAQMQREGDAKQENTTHYALPKQGTPKGGEFRLRLGQYYRTGRSPWGLR